MTASLLNIKCPRRKAWGFWINLHWLYKAHVSVLQCLTKLLIHGWTLWIWRIGSLIHTMIRWRTSRPFQAERLPNKRFSINHGSGWTLAVFSR